MRCPSRAVAAVSCVVSVLLVIPPGLFAQVGGGAAGPPIAFGLSSMGSSGVLPGQPIVTNPTALQPIAPPPPACPAPPGPPSTGGGQIPPLHEFWPLEPGTLLPPPVETRMRQEHEVRLQQGQRASQARTPVATTQPSPPAPPGASGAVAAAEVAAQAQASQGATAEAKEPLRSRDFSVEEAFAQFSVLQGVKARLRQFGYSFFDQQTQPSALIHDMPVGPDYVIGPQDSLTLHIWNVPDQAFNRSYITAVERDGTIMVPQIGVIPVGGLTFAQAERVIRARLGTLLKRFDMHLSLARLRTMKVFVVGEVVRPGAYELSALATVSHALYAACGPARSGSLRQVRVVRDGKTVAELDFYDFLLEGDRTQDRQLESGDTVVVPPIGPVVAISGAVKRPAIYELKPGMRLSDLVRLAGGLTPFAGLDRCHVFRMEKGRGRVLLDVPLPSLVAHRANGEPPAESSHETLLHDGDYVLVPSLPTQTPNVVSVMGAVKSPGPFAFQPGMRLRDVLTRDVLLPEADWAHAELVRTDPVTFQTTIISFSPRALFDGSAADNHVLQQWDQIVVMSQLRRPALVLVEGEVKRPGQYTLQTGERLSSVLKRAGGLTPQAFPQGIVLLRESVKRRQEAELQRFIAAERERLTAQAAAVTAGAVGVSGPGGAISAAEQQTLALRVQQLEALAARAELGRVVVRMESLEQLEGTTDDVVLENRDRILIPQPPQTVTVVGAVKNPTSVVYQPGLSVEDYLRQTGGLTEHANSKELYVVRANGLAESAYVKIKDVRPGDTIVVPQKVEVKTPQLALWQSVASIVGSVVLAAAGIAVIGR